MADNILNIIIAGKPNSGKSAMMAQLEKLLVENGYNVELSFNGHPDYSGENSYHFHAKESINFDTNANNIKQNKKIMLREAQIIETSENGKEIRTLKQHSL